VAAALGQAFVTDYRFYGGQSTHSMAVIAARGHAISAVPTGFYPTAVAVSPDNRRGFVAQEDGNTAKGTSRSRAGIHPTTGAVMDTLAVGGCAVGVSDNGDHVYLASQGYESTFTSKVSIVDLPSGGITSVPIHGMPNALAVSGNRIYVTDTWHSSVVQIT